MLSDRHIKIITILINKEKATSGIELSEILNVTSRTLRKDIFIINKEVSLKEIKINSSPKHGYWIKKEEKTCFKSLLAEASMNKNQIIASTPEERRIMIFYILIKNYDFKIENLCDTLFVSKTTLEKDIKELRNFIISIEPSLNHKQTSRMLKNYKEEKIRRIISSFLVLNYDNNLRYLKKYLYLLDSILEKQFLDICEYLRDELGRQNLLLTDKSLILTTLEIIIFNYREVQGCRISYIKSRNNRKVILYKNTIENILNNKITDDYFNFIIHLFNNKRMITNKDFVGFDNDKNEMIFNEFADFFKNKTGIDIFNNEDIKDHINAMLLYGNNKEKIHIYLIKEIKKLFPQAYELSCGLNYIVRKHLKKDLEDLEIATLAIRLVKVLNEQCKKVNVLIVCDYGQTYALFMRYKLQTLFSNELNIIDVIPKYYLNTKLKDQIAMDLIITTSEIEDSSIYPSICITPIVNDDDIRNIRKYLQKCKL